MSGDVEALAEALFDAIERVDDGFGYHDCESYEDREKGCGDLAATILASDWMERHDAEVRASERADWSSWLDSWTGAVGPRPPTVDDIARALRSGPRPFGAARNSEEQA